MLSTGAVQLPQKGANARRTAKKLDYDEQIKEIKSQLEDRSVKLQELQAELHHTEECICQRK